MTTRRTPLTDPDPDLDARVLERVRALLAKAESTPYEAEAAAFTAKAHELMTRHALEAAVVAGAVPDGRPIVRELALVEPYLEAKSLLLSVVAAASRCRAVRLRGTPQVTLVGFAADVAAVEVLFTSLLVQAQSALHELGRAAPPGAASRSRGFRSSFLRGYAMRIGGRLAESAAAAEADVDASAGGALLPVLARRDDEVEAEMRRAFPRLGQARISAGSDARGFHAGAAAADQADLARERLAPG